MNPDALARLGHRGQRTGLVGDVGVSRDLLHNMRSIGSNDRSGIAHAGIRRIDRHVLDASRLQQGFRALRLARERQRQMNAYL